MLFLSKHAGYVFDVRPPLYEFPGHGMQPIQVRPSLVADFGEAGGQALMSAEWSDEDGHAHADVRGGVFDSVEAAGRLGWTEEERRLVEEKMLRWCADPKFRDFWLYEKPVPVPPWPTYEQTHWRKVAPLAAELGLVREALAYEEQMAARESVLEELRGRLEAQAVEESLTAA